MNDEKWLFDVIAPDGFRARGFTDKTEAEKYADKMGRSFGGVWEVLCLGDGECLGDGHCMAHDELGISHCIYCPKGGG